MSLQSEQPNESRLEDESRFTLPSSATNRCGEMNFQHLLMEKRFCEPLVWIETNKMAATATDGDEEGDEPGDTELNNQPSTPSSATCLTRESIEKQLASSVEDDVSTKKDRPQKTSKLTLTPTTSSGVVRSRISGTLGSLMGRINSLDSKLEDLRIPQPELRQGPKPATAALLSASEAEDNEAAAIFASLVSRYGARINDEPLILYAFCALFSISICVVWQARSQ